MNINSLSSNLDLLFSRFVRSRPISFINAQVLGPDGLLGSSLRIEAGRIGDTAPQSKDLVIDLGGAVISPGLINAHDHLELNNFPRLKWRDRYSNARDWIADFRPRFKTDPALVEPLSVPPHARLLWGGIKNLLSGVTTVCHHNPLYRPLRYGFPIRVVQRYRWSHSFELDGEAVVREYRRTPKNWPWIIHLAEGTDAEAAAELERLDRLGCLDANTVIVHGVGLSAADRAKLLDKGGALIWCPASNFFMLGETAKVSELARRGRVALGSDSRLSGERDLLAELKVAYETKQVSANGLFRMVTSDAAAMLRLPQAGRLASGSPADVTIFSSRSDKPFDHIVTARRSDVRLVLIAGRPLIGDPEMAPVFAALGVAAEKVRVDGCEKFMARSIVERLRRAAINEPGLEI
ncbi:MAG: amidohydrolase family protein [candidate division KSB1 bacterium]|nr:amidohydrolase family protein [candidate division KSB1 bacterium]